MKKTYVGSCHCGAVRFEADVDISVGTVKCNCTICAKNRLWAVQAEPGAVRVISGAEEMTDYRFGEVVHHYFCKHCGIHPFDWVDLPRPREPYCNVFLAALEGIDIDELMAAPIELCDGLHDQWDSVPAEIRHL